MTDKTREFWDDQAKLYGSSDLATAPDHYYRGLEIETILGELLKIKQHETILDVGCGNGYTTNKIARKIPEATITGIDYSEPMIAAANKTAMPNVEYFVGNVLSLSRNKNLSPQHFDVVLCTRCLINLTSWESQRAAMLEMRKMLAPHGRLVLVENTEAGMENLNKLRARVDLPPIAIRWHNKYLPETEFRDFLKNGPFVTEYVENIGNMYYIASRVIYAKLCADQGIEPDYANPINAIAARLPSFGVHYACSPNFMFVLRKKPGKDDLP